MSKMARLSSGEVHLRARGLDMAAFRIFGSFLWVSFQKKADYLGSISLRPLSFGNAHKQLCSERITPSQRGRCEPPNPAPRIAVDHETATLDRPWLKFVERVISI